MVKRHYELLVARSYTTDIFLSELRHFLTMKTLRILSLNTLCLNLSYLIRVCLRRRKQISHIIGIEIVNHYSDHFFPNSNPDTLNFFQSNIVEPFNDAPAEPRDYSFLRIGRWNVRYITTRFLKNSVNLTSVEINGEKLNPEALRNIFFGLSWRKDTLRILVLKLELDRSTGSTFTKFLSLCTKLEVLKLKQIHDSYSIFLHEMLKSMLNSKSCIEKLNVSGNIFSNIPYAKSFVLENFPRITEFCLESKDCPVNMLCNEEKGFLKNISIPSRNLTKLELSGYCLTVDYFQFVAKNMNKFKSLLCLKMEFHETFHSKEVLTIDYKKLPKNVRRVELSGSRLNEYDCQTLGNIVGAFKLLSSLVIRFKSFEDTSFFHKISLSSNTPQNVTIKYNNFDTISLQQFIGKCYRLEFLHLEQFSFLPSAFPNIFPSMSSSAVTLRRLLLQRCNLNDEDGKKLGAFLEKCHNIEVFDVRCNKNLKNSFKEIFAGLYSSARSLREIYVGECVITYEGARNLSKILHACRQVEYFNFFIISPNSCLLYNEIRAIGRALEKSVGYLKRLNNQSPSTLAFNFSDVSPLIGYV